MAGMTKKQLEAYIEELQGKIDELVNSLPEKIEGMIAESENFSQFHKKIEDDTKTLTDASNAILKTMQGKLELVQAETKKFTKLKRDFEALTSDSFNTKSSKLVAADYRENAKNHQNRETVFQVICSASILAAIAILFCWLRGDLSLAVTSETAYGWLPIATITSLFLFMARWAAKIAYRHGLEARRLNQYSLDLTTMPAFFAQELLNQGDKKFQAEGKKIIQTKAEKMFGNIDRFDEQHSHSLMELLWKWITKRFESSGGEPKLDIKRHIISPDSKLEDEPSS